MFALCTTLLHSRCLLYLGVAILKANSNGSYILVKHYPTLLGYVVWSMLDCVECWSVQTNPATSNNVGFQYLARNYGIFLIETKMLDDVRWKVWTKSNFIQHRPTLSNMLDCAVQMGQTLCVKQWLIMFDQHVWSIWMGP